MEPGYSIHLIGEVSVYALHDTPQDKLTMENVVHGGKIASTVQLGPVHLVHSTGLVMTDDGYVFPADMSPEDMDRRKNSMGYVRGRG